MIKYFFKPLGYSALSVAIALIASILAAIYNGGDNRFQFYVSMKFFGLVIGGLTVWFLLLRLFKNITSRQHKNKQVNTHLFFILPFALVSYLAFYDKADLVGYFAAAMSALNTFLAFTIFYSTHVPSKPISQPAYSSSTSQVQPSYPTPNYTYNSYGGITNMASAGINTGSNASPDYNAPSYTPPPYTPPAYPEYTPPPSYTPTPTASWSPTSYNGGWENKTVNNHANTPMKQVGRYWVDKNGNNYEMDTNRNFNKR